MDENKTSASFPIVGMILLVGLLLTAITSFSPRATKKYEKEAAQTHYVVRVFDQAGNELAQYEGMGSELKVQTGLYGRNSLYVTTPDGVEHEYRGATIEVTKQKVAEPGS